MAESARENIARKSRWFSDQVAMARNCDDISASPQIHISTRRLIDMSLFVDSARLRLRNMESLIEISEQHAEYVSYKQWVLSKRSLFKDVSDQMSSLLFNPVLGLDKSLLPECNSTAHIKAIEFSTLILEEALVTTISREAERELHNFGGC